jgi:predicted deacetylase
MQRLPEPAQYLLRVDDLNPTVNSERWSRVHQLIRQFGIRPILAVIPDNRDHSLETSPSDERFWEDICAMEREGATIAMHGYQHRCTLEAVSLLPLHRKSEFAGRPLQEQRDRIRAGLELLRDRGLTPRLFVAPKHSFDHTTLSALCDEGLPYLSDGFARIPFLREGVTWIPQQLWGPASRRKGLWTICIHPDSTGPRRLSELKGFLLKHRDQFTSFDDVIKNFSLGGLSVAERLYEQLALWRILLRVTRKRMRD